jgi:hypothetical protein
MGCGVKVVEAAGSRTEIEGAAISISDKRCRTHKGNDDKEY